MTSFSQRSRWHSGKSERKLSQTAYRPKPHPKICFNCQAQHLHRLNQKLMQSLYLFLCLIPTSFLLFLLLLLFPCCSISFTLSIYRKQRDEHQTTLKKQTILNGMQKHLNNVEISLSQQNLMDLKYPEAAAKPLAFSVSTLSTNVRKYFQELTTWAHHQSQEEFSESPTSNTTILNSPKMMPGVGEGIRENYFRHHS